LRRVLATLGAWLALATPLDAHELPVVSGIVVVDDTVALRTRRGFVLYDASTSTFRLQCLEYSGIADNEIPSFASDGQAVVVATLRGLLHMSASGCGLTRTQVPGDIPVADVRWSAGQGWIAVTSAAGAVNDVYRSSDGLQWQPAGFDLDGFFAFSVAATAQGALLTGVRLDPDSSRAVFVARHYDATGAFQETVIDDEPNTLRVRIADLDLRTGQALLWLDRLSASQEPDQLLAVDSLTPSQPTLLVELPDVLGARFHADRGLWLISPDGLFHAYDGQLETRWPSTSLSALGGSGDEPVWLATEYAVTGFALAALDVQGQVVPWLRYEQIAGPTTCADAPGQCDADWLDWTTEIPQDDAPTLAPANFFERLNETPANEVGCTVPPLAPAGPTSLAGVVATALYVMRRRR
jgi:hypothetical protein